MIPELSITDLLPRAPYDLYGGYAVATDRSLPAGPGQAPGRPARPGSTPVTAAHLPGAEPSSGLRNLLYALQWWVFGAFAVFVWWRWLQEDVLGVRRGQGPVTRAP